MKKPSTKSSQPQDTQTASSQRPAGQSTSLKVDYLLKKGEPVTTESYLMLAWGVSSLDELSDEDQLAAVDSLQDAGLVS